MNSKIYVDPLGKIYDLSYNNVSIIKDNYFNIEGITSQSYKAVESYRFQLAFWSFLMIISIIAFLIFLRKIKNH